MKPDYVFPITEQSHVAESRRTAARLTSELGFEKTAAGRVAIIATEAATNLVRHALDGKIILHPVKSGSTTGLDILAVDGGPGIANIAEAMQDGYSTVGGVGTGLGSIKRQADMFDIYSVPGLGTVLLARVWATRQLAMEKKEMEWEALCFAHPAEDVSGDAYAVYQDGNRNVFMLADGLGHGVFASEAAIEAEKVFYEQAESWSPQRVIESAHNALRSTRGAAITIAVLDKLRGEVIAAGIGNVTAAVVSNGKTTRVPNYNGIVGENIRKVAEFIYPFAKGDLLVMHTDGLSSLWDISAPGLMARHPAVIAGVLFRDQYRARDDAAVLVAK